jgi:hypothetical protein
MLMQSQMSGNQSSKNMVDFLDMHYLFKSYTSMQLTYSLLCLIHQTVKNSQRKNGDGMFDDFEEAKLLK